MLDLEALQVKVVRSPIVIFGARVLDPAEHIFSLTLSEFYGPSRLRVCNNEEALYYYLDCQPGFLIGVCNEKNEKQIVRLFRDLGKSHSKITKILAYDEGLLQIADSDRDLGHDLLLGFSDKYQGDDFSNLLRRLIGPSEADLKNSDSQNHSVLSPDNHIFPVTTRRTYLETLYKPVKVCLTEDELKRVLSYGDSFSQGKIARLNSHFEDCRHCRVGIHQLMAAKVVGIREVYQDEVHRFDNAIDPRERMLQEFFPGHGDDKLTPFD